MSSNQAFPPPQGPEYVRCSTCSHIEPEHRPDAGPCLLCGCATYSPVDRGAVQYADAAEALRWDLHDDLGSFARQNQIPGLQHPQIRDELAVFLAEGLLRRRAADAYREEALAAAAVPVAAPPTTEQTALRERVEEALLTTRRTDYEGAARHGEHRYDARCALCAGDVDALTAAVLAVLPAPADRAATLREAADLVDALDRRKAVIHADTIKDAWEEGRDAGADLLRRLAAEAPHTETPGGVLVCDGCGHLEHRANKCPTTQYGERCACDEPLPEEAAPPREPHPTEADLRHAQAVLARFHGRDTDGPAVVAQPGKENCPAAHGALGRICELPTGHAGMHTGSGPNGGAVWDGDAS